jgi:hypothetical protein
VAVHIYTQTIHRTTQITTNVEESGSCPVFTSFTLAFALQLRKKLGKTSVRVRKTCRVKKNLRVQYTFYQNTHTLQNPHKHTHYKCNMFSFGCFPGVWVLIADVSEHSIGSIFKGRSTKYDRDWDVWGIYTGPFSGRSVAEPLGRWVAGWGWLGGGRYIRRVRVGSLHYIRWPSLFLEFV